MLNPLYTATLSFQNLPIRVLKEALTSSMLRVKSELVGRCRGVCLVSSFLPDEPIDNATRFGFATYSRALSSIVKSKELETPFTIAIHGEWGSGKTSLMKTLCKQLEFVKENEVKVRTVWFDAWEFEKIPIPLWKIFLNRIAMDLQDIVTDSGLKDKFKAAGEGFLLLASDILLKNLVGTSLEEIKKIKAEVWSDIKKINSLGEEFSQCIEEALRNDPSKAERLVVFVDDLDRCLPEQCVEVFESMKLFLNSRRCVFVIGVNKEQICRAFEIKFGEKGPLGLNYMEKFIQLQFDLPRKNPVEVQSFLTEFASEQLRGSPKTVELISRFIEPNPRKVKRWLNSVIFLEELFKTRQESQVFTSQIDMSLVSIWLFLKSFFLDFAARIENDPSLLNSSIKAVTGKGSEEDKRKIGDYVIDHRLSDFLSTLKSDYDEEQLKEVVYLSKLTPIEQVSTMPAQMLSRISEMPDEELSDQIDKLTDYGLSMLAGRIINNLSNLQTVEEYKENLPLFGLLERLIQQATDDSKKVLLFEKILAFKESSAFGYRYFLKKMSTFASSAVIKARLLDLGFLAKIVTEFAASSSYDDAVGNSAMLINFSDKLTTEQMQVVIKACLENDQIYNSFGARKNLVGLLVMHKALMTPDQKAKIKKQMYIDIPE
jgi:hypothetical protein